VEASFKRASDVVAALFSRRPDGAEAHMLETPEPTLPREWPDKLPFRKRPKPYSRSIAWAPAGQEDARAVDKNYELFVSQSVLSEVRQHLITATSGEPFGFLIGQVAYCPWAEAPYIVIDSVRRETQDLPPANEFDRFRHAWVAATREARHRRGEVLGWYHRHGVLGLRLSEWDLHLQEEFFPEPWHCALVIASSSRGIIGGFIQRSRRARLFRKGLAPFHEIVELDAKLLKGLRPSVVDWQNYRAGEAVSVIKANWPGASTRQKKWKAKAHGEGVDLPTQGGSVAPGAQPKRKGSLGGRSWRPETSEKRAGPGRPDDAPLAADDFADAVRLQKDPVVFESEFSLDDEESARKRRKKKTAARKKKPPASRQASDEAPPEEPATAEPTEEGAEGGAWYSSDFKEAVWGPHPFETEADEGPVSRDDEAEATAQADDGGSGDAVATPPERSQSRFELVPTFEPEPSEVDGSGSMDWLLGLIGDTLAARASGEEEAKVDPEPESVAEEDAATDVSAAEGTREPAAEPTEEAGEGEEAVEEARASATRQTAESAPASTAPTGPRPAGARGPTYVTPSYAPDTDPEAAIPVVILAEDTGWRPTKTQIRRALVAAGLILAVLVVRTVFFTGGDVARAPDRPVAAPPTVAPPTPEFITLADQFLTALQTFRQGMVAFRLGQTDCAGLGSSLETLAAAHSTLGSYVATAPELGDRFAGLDAEFVAARGRFAVSDCEFPPGMAPQDPSAGALPPS